MSSIWQDRIIGNGHEAPDQLMAHPSNWRIHPEQQKAVLRGVLDEVGWVQRVIVNQATGHIVDGHLRVMLALRDEVPAVPVLYIELSEAEEAIALAGLDTFTAMAKSNAHLFEQLLETLNTGNADLMEYLAERARALGIGDDPDMGKEADSGEEYDEGDFNNLEHECPECGFTFDA